MKFSANTVNPKPYCDVYHRQCAKKIGKRDTNLKFLHSRANTIYYTLIVFIKRKKKQNFYHYEKNLHHRAKW